MTTDTVASVIARMRSACDVLSYYGKRAVTDTERGFHEREVRGVIAMLDTLTAAYEAESIKHRDEVAAHRAMVNWNHEVIGKGEELKQRAEQAERELAEARSRIELIDGAISHVLTYWPKERSALFVAIALGPKGSFTPEEIDKWHERARAMEVSRG
jgi:hypothetical protein